MDNIINVANYVVDRYYELTGETLDEMKLHKLLYFIQRESFAILGKPAFDGVFEGWKYGPVSREVRNRFKNGKVLNLTVPVSDDIQYIASNVIMEYGSLASWKLSDLSHRETSWINSRKGLASEENGNQIIDTNDIREDAKKVRPYDSMWDMFYDEFDDDVEEVTSK